MPQYKPKNIVFEGIDKAGKSTQARILAKRLGKEAILTKEPGGTEEAEAVRKILLDNNRALTAEEQTTLMAISRRLTQTDVVIPGINSGRTVIRDRSFLSSLAYQGEGGQLGPEYVLSKNIGPWLVIPNLVMLFEPPATLLEEADSTSFEAETVEFKERVRLGFANLPETICRLSTQAPFADFTDLFGQTLADIRFATIRTSVDGVNLKPQEVQQQVWAATELNF